MSEHILSSKLYWTIWAILIVLTFITAWVATIDLGPLNTIVALVIASGKALLVVLFFMHVKYTSEKLTRVVIVSALFWLLILLGLSLTDYFIRHPGVAGVAKGRGLALRLVPNSRLSTCRNLGQPSSLANRRPPS